jgi:2-C-methyl-D-erythritol 4-phosphate cytidylyltransferase
MKYYAIIVGGGSGSRMNSDVPKQFLVLNGRPVLMRTIEAFYSSELQPEIIVVLNTGFHAYWTQLCKDHNFTIPHQLAAGGSQRFHSVKNGLQYVQDNSVVAIHDAVRPLVTQNLITAAFHQAKEKGSAVAAIKSKDSVRQQTSNGTIGLNRDEIYLIQTPQVFRSEILNKAYEQEYTNEFTDDASVVERSGEAIALIEGDVMNLKITFPEDILLAGIYLQEN